MERARGGGLTRKQRIDGELALAHAQWNIRPGGHLQKPW